MGWRYVGTVLMKARLYELSATEASRIVEIPGTTH